MATYIILSKQSQDSSNGPENFRKIADEVSERIKTECPDVKWKDSYATIGPYDVVDVVEATAPSQVAKAAMIIRKESNSMTTTMTASPWKEFLDEF